MLGELITSKTRLRLLLKFFIYSNINMGGDGNFAFPGPNNLPFAQSISSSYLKLFFFNISLKFKM